MAVPIQPIMAAPMARDVVVARGDVDGQRAQGIERRLVAVLELLGHVGLDHVHGHMAGAFDHGLHLVLPGDRQLAQGAQLGKLGFVVGVDAQPGRRPSPRLKLTSYCFMMSQMSSKCSYRKLSRWCAMHHLAMMEPPRDDAGAALAVRWIGQAHAGVDGEVVHALLGLLDQGVAEDFPGQVFGDAADFSSAW
jgi:hypothetical protein